MSKKKTIFDIYRENDANFSSQPSNDAWSKLEGKLDGKSQIQPIKKKGRVIRMNFLSIAAGFLILVGIGSFFLLQSGNNATTESAVAFNSKKYQTEDLILTDSDNNFFNEQRIAADYKARFASNRTADNSIFADDSKRSAKSSKSLQPRRINQKPQELIAYNDDSEKNTEVNSIYDQIESDLIEKIETNEVATSRFETADYPQTRQKSSAISSEKATDSVPVVVNSSIKNFDWLVGSWEQQIGGMKSVEKWVADTFNTISGTGYLVQGDDTIFTERPTIKQIGNKIYFFQNIETSESLVPYELMVQTDSQWVFENKNPNLPREVVLKRGVSDFQIELRSTSPSNQSFLKNRNALISNTARRNLKRMN